MHIVSLKRINCVAGVGSTKLSKIILCGGGKESEFGGRGRGIVVGEIGHIRYEHGIDTAELQGARFSEASSHAQLPPPHPPRFHGGCHCSCCCCNSAVYTNSPNSIGPPHSPMERLSRISVCMPLSLHFHLVILRRHPFSSLAFF